MTLYGIFAKNKVRTWQPFPPMISGQQSKFLKIPMMASEFKKMVKAIDFEPCLYLRPIEKKGRPGLLYGHLQHPAPRSFTATGLVFYYSGYSRSLYAAE